MPSTPNNGDAVALIPSAPNPVLPFPAMVVIKKPPVCDQLVFVSNQPIRRMEKLIRLIIQDSAPTDQPEKTTQECTSAFLPLSIIPQPSYCDFAASLEDVRKPLIPQMRRFGIFVLTVVAPRDMA
jgi:hypothetical protein